VSILSSAMATNAISSKARTRSSVPTLSLPLAVDRQGFISSFTLANLPIA
jgi:hypothetical protein